MGRLDDIAKRNRDATMLDSPIITAIADTGPSRPEAPPPPFSLPSQRRGGFAVWKVIVAIVILIGVVGGYSWYQMDRERTERGSYNP